MADLKNLCIDGHCFGNTEPAYTEAEVDALLAGKQDELTAGSNIQIDPNTNTISATDTTYQNATQSTAGLMSAQDKTKLDNIDLSDYLTCADLATCQTIIDMQSDISDKADASDVYTKTQTDTLLNGKQNTLTAGTGISITNDVISCTLDTDIFEVVQSLPAVGEENKIYLVPKQGGGFTEWAYINNAWEEIGDTDIDLSNYYNKTETDALLADKADASSVYTKTETDTLLSDKADASTVYTKTETDNLLDDKADANTVYTKTETDTLLADKADASTVYTKTETDTLLADKADASTVYTKTETDTLLADKLECSDLASCQTIIDMNTAISGKQDALTAGSNIQLNGSTISATDTTYSDATQSTSGLMSAQDKTKLDGLQNYTAGQNVTISNGEISATDTTYSDATQSDSGLMSAADKTKLDEMELIWGKDETNGGIYYPRTLEPERVANNSVLITEATKMTVGTNRIFALVGGVNVNLKITAQAGATRFEVSNTFANRFICAVARGGYATINQSTASETIVNVTAVYCANDPDTPLVPYSGANEPSNNIIIETDAPVSDTDTTKVLRLYGTMTYDTSLHCGMGVGTGGVTGKGKLLQLGQSQLALDGNSLLVGNSMFTSKNRVILVGANHINHIQSACMTGEGHDSVNGTKTGLTAHGLYSEITANTMFVIGNGTANTARNNLFEIADNNGATEVIMKSPNNTAWKLTVDDSGNLSVTQA